MESKYDIAFNILIVGNASTGKSCLLLRYTDDVFCETTQMTVGLDFKAKIIEMNGKFIEVRSWDTAGLERFKAITDSYYNGADAVLLCYDVTNRDTFDALIEWINVHPSDVNQKNQKIIRILVATKTDEKDKEVTSDDGKLFANKYGYLYIETSSKYNTNVNETFMLAVNELLKIRTFDMTGKRPITGENFRRQSQKSSCC